MRWGFFSKKSARLVPAAVAAVCMVLWGPAASAQTAALEELVKASDTLARAVLHALSTAQQVYYMDHQTYTDDLSALKNDGNFQGHPDVKVTITKADGNGWRGTAQHRKSPNVVVFDSDQGGFQD